MSADERLAAIASALRPLTSEMKGLTPQEFQNHQTIKEMKGLTPQEFPNHQTIKEMKGLTPQEFPNHQTIKPSNHQTRVVALPFTQEMKGLTPQEFITFMKREFPGLEAIRCGHNWRFGARGAGNANFARNMGLTVEEVPFVMHGGEAVSSTRIRNALSEGDLENAAAMLGRKWSMTGVVFSGKGEGRKMGFPTINIRPIEGSVPLRTGVYSVETELGLGMANWGKAPTMGKDAWTDRVLEVHLKEWCENMPPPEKLSVTFLKFIRGEMTFPTKEALAAQIAADCKIADTPMLTPP